MSPSSCFTLLTRLKWLSITPLVSPVVPEEYGSAARSLFGSIDTSGSWLELLFIKFQKEELAVLSTSIISVSIGCDRRSVVFLNNSASESWTINNLQSLSDI